MNMVTNRAKAYSYIRFSSPEQADGDSLRRQTEAATAYCERHGLDLTDMTYRDLGLSAAAGANAAIGALGQFVQAVETGKVRPGSYLLIEKMDRLSRDKVRQARDRFEALLDAGIVVVTLAPERVYRAESYDLTDMIVTLVEMTQARQFSENLSYRVGAAWHNKRERAAVDGHKMTRRAPAWLRLRNGNFEVIEDRAAVVRRIFDMASRGHGKAAIAKTLNAEGVEPFGDGEGMARKADGWHRSYIHKILGNSAVIGVYQPMRRARKFEKERVTAGEPIADYFPAVVEESVYYAVMHAKPAPSGKGRHPLRNVLSGLAVCAKCGGKMHRISKGPLPKGGQYFGCDNARRFGKCDAQLVKYGLVVDQVIDAVKSFRVIEPDNSAAKERDREIDALGGKIAELEKVIEGLAVKIERTESATLERRLVEREAELKALKSKRQELREKTIARTEPTDWQATAKLVYALRAMSRGETANEESTVHIAAELRRMVERVEIEKGKPVRVVPTADFEAAPAQKRKRP